MFQVSEKTRESILASPTLLPKGAKTQYEYLQAIELTRMSKRARSLWSILLPLYSVSRSFLSTHVKRGRGLRGIWMSRYALYVVCIYTMATHNSSDANTAQDADRPRCIPAPAVCVAGSTLPLEGVDPLPLDPEVVVECDVLVLPCCTACVTPLTTTAPPPLSSDSVMPSTVTCPPLARVWSGATTKPPSEAAVIVSSPKEITPDKRSGGRRGFWSR